MQLLVGLLYQFEPQFRSREFQEERKKNAGRTEHLVAAPSEKKEKRKNGILQILQMFSEGAKHSARNVVIPKIAVDNR